MFSDNDQLVGGGEYGQPNGKQRSGSNVQLGNSSNQDGMDPSDHVAASYDIDFGQKIPIVNVSNNNNNNNKQYKNQYRYQNLRGNDVDAEIDIRSNKCIRCLNCVFDCMILWCIIRRCGCWRCCICCNNNGNSSSNSTHSGRSMFYTSLSFGYSWAYFISAMWFVPFAAQMSLNSLATATAVVIFIKRKELGLKDFRILSGVFTPIVIFMSAYAIWNEKSTIDDEIANNELSK